MQKYRSSLVEEVKFMLSGSRKSQRNRRDRLSAPVFERVAGPSRRQIETKELQTKIKNTTQYILEHGTSAYAQYMATGIPSKLPFIKHQHTFSRKNDVQVYEILQLLAKMGFANADIPGKQRNYLRLLHIRLQTYDGDNLHEEFLDSCYRMFQTAVESHKFDDATLKKLKKALHDFAEQHEALGLRKKIVNLMKQRKKEREKGHDTLTSYQELNAIFGEEHLFSEKYIAPEFANLSNAEAETPDDEDKGRFKEYLDSVIPETLPDEEKLKMRRKKWWVDSFAKIATIVTSFSEGVVAGALAAVPGFVAALGHAAVLVFRYVIVNAGGYFANYFLVNEPCKQAFRQIFIYGFKQDSQGRALSKKKQFALYVAFAISVVAGITFACLAIGSIITAAGSLGLAWPYWFIAIPAAIPAATVFLSLGSLFFVTYADIIIEERLTKGIKQYLLKHYYYTGWLHATLLQRSIHAVKCIANTVFLIVLTYVWTLVLGALVGLYQTSMVSFIMHALPATKAAHIAAVVTAGIFASFISTGVAFGPFNYKALLLFTTLIYDTAKSILKSACYKLKSGIVFTAKIVSKTPGFIRDFIARPRAFSHESYDYVVYDVLPKFKDAFFESVENSTSVISNSFRRGFLTFVMGCVAINGYGQGSGMSKGLSRYVDKHFFSFHPGDASDASGQFNSDAGNANGAIDELSSTPNACKIEIKDAHREEAIRLISDAAEAKFDEAIDELFSQYCKWSGMTTPPYSRAMIKDALSSGFISRRGRTTTDGYKNKISYGITFRKRWNLCLQLALVKLNSEDRNFNSLRRAEQQARIKAEAAGMMQNECQHRNTYYKDLTPDNIDVRTGEVAKQQHDKFRDSMDDLFQDEIAVEGHLVEEQDKKFAADCDSEAVRVDNYAKARAGDIQVMQHGVRYTLPRQRLSGTSHYVSPRKVDGDSMTRDQVSTAERLSILRKGSKYKYRAECRVIAEQEVTKHAAVESSLPTSKRIAKQTEKIYKAHPPRSAYMKEVTTGSIISDIGKNGIFKRGITTRRAEDRAPRRCYRPTVA